MKVVVELGRVESFRVEVAADPLDECRVALVGRIGDGDEELLVAPRAAAVLGRACRLAGEASRHLVDLAAGEDLLDDDVVVPVVAEVVDVAELVAFGGQFLLSR